MTIVGLALLLVGCPEVVVIDGGGVDGGDAGAPFDAGAGTDASVDEDAGAMPDAGPPLGVGLSLSPVTSFVRTGGALYSAGSNDREQRGRLLDVTPNVFARQDTSIQFIDVAAMQLATCGIDVGGRLYCWGSNGGGLLGLGDDNGARVETSPVAVGTDTWIDVEAGNLHACAIRADRRLFCWGVGQSGALGDGAERVNLAPNEVAGEGQWSRVSPGDAHTCAIRTDGALFCWGEGEFGRLGQGTEESSSSPVRVGTDSDWTEVSAGVQHICGIRGGALYCWGDSQFGRLGVADSLEPVPSPQLVDDSRTWRTIAAGQFHTCAITDAAELFCFGIGPRGQLGVPELNPLGLVQVEGRFDVVATGWDHTCAVERTDTALAGLRCWGGGTSGKLGIGNTDDEQEPTQPMLLPAP